MTQYQKPTDEVHKVKLTSKLSHALWISQMVCVGEKAPFEVWTHFVGSGSDIQVEVIDKKGKIIAKIKGKVYGNYYSDFLEIPEKAQEALMFTVKLPKHKLVKKSDICLILPPIKINNQKWGQKEARRGDTVKLTADVEDIEDGREVMINILEYDVDGAHDFITKFPCKVQNKKLSAEWIYEYHEDTDEIPTDQEMQKHGKNYNHPEYFWIAEYGRKRFGDKQESGLLRFKDWEEFFISDEFNKPIIDKAYILTLADGKQRKGNTDKNGYIFENSLPPGRFELTIDGDMVEMEHKGVRRRKTDA